MSLTGGREMQGEQNPIESLHSCMAFHVRDWSNDRRDAWMYGIIIGWKSALPALAAQHQWSSDEVKRLRLLRARFVEIARKAGKAGGRGRGKEV